MVDGILSLQALLKALESRWIVWLLNVLTKGLFTKIIKKNQLVSVKQDLGHMRFSYFYDKSVKN